MDLSQKLIQSLVKRLKRLSFDAASEYLEDAWLLATEEPPKSSRTMFVFHALRELNRVLRAYGEAISRLSLPEETIALLEASAPKRTDNKESRLAIYYALTKEALGFAPTDMQKKAAYDGKTDFHKLGHAPTTTQRKWTREKILSVMGLWIEYILIPTLDAIEQKIAHVFKLVEKIAEKNPHELSELEKNMLEYILQNSILLSNFLSKITRFEWVEYLRTKKLFAKAPSKIYAADGSYRFAPWPIPHFLGRMVDSPDITDAQRQVIVDIITNVDDSHESFIIYNGLLEVAIKLPARFGKQVIPKFSIWAPHIVGFNAGFDVVKFIKRLLNDGEPNAAVEAFYTYFKLGLLSRQHHGRDIDSHSWQLKEFLKGTLELIVDVDGIKLFEHLLSETNDMIDLAVGPEAALLTEEWRTYFWKERSTFGNTQNERDIVSTLINSVVICAEKLLQNGESLDKITLMLDAYPWLTMKRIQYYLLSRHAMSDSQISLKQKLNQKLGRQERAERSFASGVVNSISPKSLEELEEMGWTAIAEMLCSEMVDKLPHDAWSHGSKNTPDIRGLNISLGAFVLKSPDQVLSNWGVLKVIPLKFVVVILGGLLQADIKDFYNKTLPIFKWLNEDVMDVVDGEIKTSLGNVLQQIINNKLVNGEKGVRKLGTPVPNILMKMIADNNLDIISEIEQFNENLEGPFSAYHNNSATQALSLFLKVYIHCGMNTYQDVATREDINDFEIILNDILAYDSLAFTSVLAAHTSAFLYLVPQWTRDNLIPRLFESHHVERRLVAILNFLRGTQIAPELKARYIAWLELYKTQPESKRIEWHIATALIGHVMYFHFDENISALNPNSWAYKAFDESSLAFKKRILEHLRHFIDGSEVDSKSFEMFKELFEWRVEVGEPSEGMTIFNWLDSALKRDQTWTMNQVTKVLKKNRYVENDRVTSRADLLIHYLADLDISDIESLANLLVEWASQDDIGYVNNPDVIKLLNLLRGDISFHDRLNLIIQKIIVLTSDESFLRLMPE